MRSENNADRTTPGRRTEIGLFPFCGIKKRSSQIPSKTMHEHLTFGITEPDVKFKNFGPLGSHHQARIQKARKRCAFAIHLRNRRQHDSVHDFARLSLVQNA